jgi:hypothetical protein
MKLTALGLLPLSFSLSAATSPLFQPSPAGMDDFVTLGLGANCDYQLGIDAINDILLAGNTTIRITTELALNESVDLSLADQTDLIGGYSNCQSAANNDSPTGLTTFNGTGLSSPIMSSDSRHDSHRILLKNLHLTQSTESALVIDDSLVEMILVDMIIDHNGPDDLSTASNHGGGIQLNGHFDNDSTRSNIVVFNTLVRHNTANQGGGLFCQNASVHVFGQTGITHNEANYGGGMAIKQGCQLTFLSGTDVTDENTTVGIANNHANRFGGGIYQTSITGNHYGAAELNLFSHAVVFDVGLVLGNPNHPVNVSNNTALSTGFSSLGGGIYLQGGQINASGLILANNESMDGGGLAITNFNGTHYHPSQARIYRHDSCWNANQCNQIKANHSGFTFGNGGAFYLGSNLNAQMNQLTVSQAWISENRADEGVVLYQTGNGIVDFNNTIVTQNGNNGGQFFADAGLWTFTQLTASNTQLFTFINNTVVNNPANEQVFDLIFQTQGIIAASIIQQPTLSLASGSVNSVFSCLLTDNTDGTDPSNSEQIMFSQDPGFTLIGSNPYELSMDSAAIDQCDLSAFTLNDFDYRGLDRSYDFAHISNDSGPVDMGAVEMNDVIFIDDFE